MAVPGTDLSYRVLENVLGTGWETIGPTTTPATGAPHMIFGLLELFNHIIMVAAAFLVAVIALQTIIKANTVNKSAGGWQVMSGVINPVVGFFGILLLMPTPQLTSLQIAVLKGTYFSIEKANDLWGYGLDTVKTFHTLGNPQVHENRHEAELLAKNIMVAHAAQAYSLAVNFDLAGDEVVTRPGLGHSVGDDSRVGVGTTVAGSNKYHWVISAVNTKSHWNKDPAAKLGVHAADFLVVTQQCHDASDAAADPVCQKRNSAVNTLIYAMRPYAMEVVRKYADAEVAAHTYLSTEAHAKLTRATLDALVTTYLRKVSASGTALATAAGSDHTAAVNEFVKSAKANGWMHAGAWYWVIGGIQQKTQKLLSLKPIIALNPKPEQSGIIDKAHLSDLQKVVAEAGQIFTDTVNARQVTAHAGAASTPGNAGQSAWEKTVRWIRNQLNKYFAGGLVAYYVDQFRAGDPVSKLTDVGHTIIATSSAIGAAAAAIHVTKGTTKGSSFLKFFDVFGVSGAMASGAEIMVFIAMALLAALLPIAFTLAYYLPAIPLITWVIGSVGWLVLLLECLVAAPIWAMAHMLPGSTLGTSRMGYMLFFNILLRPSLMVLGLLLAMAVMTIVGPILHELFLVFIGSSAAHYSFGIISSWAMITLFTFITIAVCHRVFDLINFLPTNVLRWIGQAVQPLGVGRTEHQIGQQVGAASRTGIGTGGAVGGKLQQRLTTRK